MMDIKMKTEDVQEAVREYYIRRGYARERLVDIHVKGGRTLKHHSAKHNGTVELTVLDTYIRPIEDEIIAPPLFNSASEDVSGFVNELEGIMDNTPPELSEDKQLEMLLPIDNNLSATESKPDTAGNKFKNLFS